MKHLWIIALALLGCGSDGGPTLDAGTLEPCVVDEDCIDGVFCNGEERCAPADVAADRRGCVPGVRPCEPGECDEPRGMCRGGCPVPDNDDDGVASVDCGGTDCDDFNPEVYPGALEICDADGLDEDCDPNTFGFRDLDGDGVGDAACCNGENCGSDCDDNNANVARDRAEACDNVDNDCDGAVDEGSRTTYYADLDSDDFGDPDGELRMACSQPVGFSENSADCNDSSSQVSPGAPEVCDQFGKNNCDEAVLNPFDADGDGFDRYDQTSCPFGRDCDDGNPFVFPGAAEICDGVDNDCAGSGGDPVCEADNCQCEGACDGTCTESGVPGGCFGHCEGTCTGCLLEAGMESCADIGGTFVPAPFSGEDADGDGFLAVGETCLGGPLTDLPRTDCDDSSADVNPSQEEVCDGVDNDCDGTIDERNFADEPRPPMRLVGGGTPDLSCRGVHTWAAPGATTTSTATVYDWIYNTTRTTADVVFFDGVDTGPYPICDAMSPVPCQVVQTTNGEVTWSHPAGDAFTFTLTEVFAGPAGEGSPVTIGRYLPGVDPGELFTAAPSDFAPAGSLLARVVDCNGQVIDGLQLRLYVPDPGGTLELSCASGWFDVSRYFDPDQVAHLAGMLVSGIGDDGADESVLATVEAWGRPSAGAPFELVARETMRVMGTAVSVLTMQPLRADGPPAP